MGSKIDVKKWMLASLAVFVAFSILEFIAQRAFMIQSFPEFFPQVPEGRDILLLRIYNYVGRAIFSIAFVYMFVKGFEGATGLTEGVRFGLWVGVLTALPSFFAFLVISNFTVGALLAKTVTGFIELVLCGMLANWFFQKKAAA